MKKTQKQKIQDWHRKREEAIRIANTLPVKSLTLEQATALLTPHPEWD